VGEEKENKHTNQKTPSSTERGGERGVLTPHLLMNTKKMMGSTKIPMVNTVKEERRGNSSPNFLL